MADVAPTDPHSGAPRPRRVAIVGGGMGGLAAALALTDDPTTRSRFDVTVYQMGWRLGGKCASGRNLPMACRSEEHGLHVWFGCYENAIDMLRRVYAERNPPATIWPSSMDEAFEPQSKTPYMEQDAAGKWSQWPNEYQRFGGRMEKPVGGGVPFYLRRVAAYVKQLIDENIPDNRRLRDVLPPAVRALSRRALIARDLDNDTPVRFDEAYARIANAIPPGLLDGAPEWRDALLSLLEPLGRWASEIDAVTAKLRRVRVMLDLSVHASAGIVRQVLLSGDWRKIDQFDLKDWLRQNGARGETVESVPVRALYDLFFAYENGDLAAPSFSAASAVPALLRILFRYPDAVVYEMTAGMGEIVIAPIYEVLRKRGVRFEFFHRLDGVTVSPDGRRVTQLRFGRQATATGAYDPLIQVPTASGRQIVCWTSELPTSITLSSDATSPPYDLESLTNQPPDVEQIILTAGAEPHGFDTVVLAIAAPALADACKALEVSAPWKHMVGAIRTSPTMSAQLWMTVDLAALGWAGGPVAMDAGPEPLDVWADRTVILDTEPWPPPVPRSLQYLCGPLAAREVAVPANRRDLGKNGQTAVTRLTRDWLTKSSFALWPAFASPTAVRWDWLFDHDNHPRPDDRLAAQYLRANIDPAQLYVISPPGSAANRLAPDRSGFDNLYLAGDWTLTSWNVGCVEAAVVSGRVAAQAILALPDP